MLYHIIILMDISEIGIFPWSVLESQLFESVNVTMLATPMKLLKVSRHLTYFLHTYFTFKCSLLSSTSLSSHIPASDPQTNDVLSQEHQTMLACRG